MDEIDWDEELRSRDLAGLLTPENQDAALVLAADAVDLLRTQFPAASTALKGSRTIRKVVVDAVFRVLRDDNNEGLVRESDGTYSYSRSSGYQSSVIDFTRSEREWLQSFVSMPAFGGVRRGGIGGVW